VDLENKRTVTICAGVSGTGKSTFALRYWSTRSGRPFLFRSDGEFAERLDLAPAGDAYELGLALCNGWVIFDPHGISPAASTRRSRFSANGASQ